MVYYKQGITRGKDSKSVDLRDLCEANGDYYSYCSVREVVSELKLRL